VNRVARGLKTSRSFTSDARTDITNPFFPPMVRGAGDGLSQAGYTLVLADTDNDPGKERLHQALMLERQVDGCCWDGSSPTTYRGAITTGLPFALVNRTIDRGGVSAVIPTTRQVWRLRSTTSTPCHRIIGHIAGPATTSTALARGRIRSGPFAGAGPTIEARRSRSRAARLRSDC
jgi:LacI family transcriptional regulator